MCGWLAATASVGPERPHELDRRVVDVADAVEEQRALWRADHHRLLSDARPRARPAGPRGRARPRRRRCGCPRPAAPPAWSTAVRQRAPTGARPRRWRTSRAGLGGRRSRRRTSRRSRSRHPLWPATLGTPSSVTAPRPAALGGGRMQSVILHLRAAVQQLYAVPPGRFTAAAHPARGQRRSPRATPTSPRQISALRKPTVAAWAVNHFVREHARRARRVPRLRRAAPRGAAHPRRRPAARARAGAGQAGRRARPSEIAGSRGRGRPGRRRRRWPEVRETLDALIADEDGRGDGPHRVRSSGPSATPASAPSTSRTPSPSTTQTSRRSPSGRPALEVLAAGERERRGDDRRPRGARAGPGARPSAAEARRGAASRPRAATRARPTVRWPCSRRDRRRSPRGSPTSSAGSRRHATRLEKVTAELERGERQRERREAAGGEAAARARRPTKTTRPEAPVEVSLGDHESLDLEPEGQTCA